jgi:hypothetical protein
LSNKKKRAYRLIFALYACPLSLSLGCFLKEKAAAVPVGSLSWPCALMRVLLLFFKKEL